MILTILFSLSVFAQDVVPETLDESAHKPKMKAEESLGQEKLDALRSYRRNYLHIESEMYVQGGGNTAFFGTGGPQLGMSFSDPVVTTHRLAIYQGPYRLDSMSFLKATKQEKMAADVQLQLNKYQNRSTAGYVIAGTGVTAVVASLIGRRIQGEESMSWAPQVSLGGTVFMIGGLLGASIPGSKRAVLSRTPFMVYTPKESEVLIDRHNDELRESLNLTVEDVWLIEGDSGTDRR